MYQILNVFYFRYKRFFMARDQCFNLVIPSFKCIYPFTHQGLNNINII